MGTKSKNWREELDRWIDARDRYDSFDPQIPERFFVSLCDETPGYSESSDEVETPEPDQSKLTAAVWTTFDDALTRQEQFVLSHRLAGCTYAWIANVSKPRLSGPSQARKIEQRALRKMRERLSKFRKPKPDTSDV